MSRDEIERLRDIRDAVDAINAHVARARSEPGLQDDPLFHDALLYEDVARRVRLNVFLSLRRRSRARNRGPGAWRRHVSVL